MFGKNPIRPVVTDGSHLAVQEMFYTLQGEGPFSGEPCVFVRLAGCNLACHFCDTEFESQAENPRPVDSIMEELESRFSPAQRHLIVLTGGEPMRQNFMPLLVLLFATGTRLVQIETAGTLWVPGLERYIRWASEEGVEIVCSPKTPQLNVNVRAHCRHWKYIVRAGEAGPDGLPMRGTQLSTMDKTQKIFRPSALTSEGGPGEHGETIWLSPCDDYDEAKNKANMEAARDLCLKHGYRLSLQIHKLVNVA